MKHPIIDNLDLRPEPFDVEFVWDWPAPPACSGRRDIADFLPVTLKTGDTFSVRVHHGPFGFTVIDGLKVTSDA